MRALIFVGLGLVAGVAAQAALGTVGGRARESPHAA